jgi:hypothetical protein
MHALEIIEAAQRSAAERQIIACTTSEISAASQDRDSTP